ncbi:hypothetical protein BX666DRAFT_1921121 [Dichotomocladium elegans]|nr:hypothetical protein BX666DRAFT_1921121 [Dichotomocladium elegans]
MLPAKMLLRFGRVLRPSMKTSPRIVAYPEVGQKETSGQKSFIKLQKSILEQVEKGANYKAVFRGECDVFDTEMSERVQHELQMYARNILNPRWMVNLNASFSTSREWSSPVPLQCVLILRDPSISFPFCELDHMVNSESSSIAVPCYDVRRIWQQQQIDSLIDPSDQRERIVTGIIKSPASVEFAIALWRCRQYLE